MKTFRRLMMAAGCAASLAACSEAGKYEMPEVAFSESEEAQIQKLNESSLMIFNAIREEGKPLFMSPLSIVMDMGQLMNISDKDMSELLKFTGSEDVEEMNVLFSKAMQVANTDKQGVKSSISNSVFFNSQYPVIGEGRRAVEEYYRSDTYVRDFTDSKTVSDEMSSWIRKKTENLIDVDDIDVMKECESYALNAMYFKGTWKNRFDPADTREDDFHGYGGTRKESMMHQEKNCLYCGKDGFQAVQIPFKDEDYVMTVVMGDNALAEDAFKSITSSFRVRRVTLTLPKFETTTDISSFPEEVAEFNGFRHVAKVSVDESGTEAAAATIIGFGSDQPIRETFTADKPFYYIISQKSSGLILYMGYYC